MAQSQEGTLATPQMQICQGLKLFGSQGMKAVKAELQQLHDLKVMAAKPLTAIQKREALGYLMFLKQKRSGKIKARGCADGTHSGHIYRKRMQEHLLYQRKLCS